jgi:hypothetical protein
MSEQEKRDIPEEFTKIIKDFVSDILITFPEYQPIIDKWWKPNEFLDIEDIDLRNEAICLDAQEKMQGLFEHCVRVFPERFFDILYQKDEIFEPESQVNTEFLPGISFKYLWQCDITDKTRETMWKYLQMVLICIIGSVKDKESLGDTSKLFDAINEEEFKSKLEETLGNMQGIFENMAKENADGNPEYESIPGMNMPSADDIHSHLHNMMGGKLGNLAREIAEETTNNLDIDMENVTDVKDVFQKLFSNPGKLMDLVKNVGEKLDSRMKSGEISQNELMTEASQMLNKMKNMPGMGNIQEMMSKMGMPGGEGGVPNMADLAAMAGMAGLGRNTKIDVNAMQQRMEKQTKQDAFKARLRKKMEEKNLAKLTAAINSQKVQPVQQVPAISDAELISMFSTGEKVERTPRGPNPKNSDGKKKKKKKV